MSESEKRKRNGYRKNRDLWIFVHSAIIAVVTVSALIFGIVAHNLAKTYYIGYHESGNINYNVYLTENEFFETPSLGPDQAYVASLIDNIVASFNYQISMDTSDVNYEYSYSIKSRLEILDKTSNAPLYNPEEVLVDKQRLSQNSASTLFINESVRIDYNAYNELANKFMETYELSAVSSHIVVTLEVHVLSSCTAFTGNSTDTYTSELRIPLTQKTVNIEMTATTPPPESNFVACTRGAGSEVFKTAAIVLAVIDVLLILLLIAFVVLTRTPDTTYNGRVKRIIAQYKSYIQRIHNPFDTDGYQVILVDTFDEMLEIRDTIQAPILMYENDDRTCTKFLIPTSNNLLYQYAVRVEGYEEPAPEPKAKPEPTTIVKPHITNVVKPVVKVVMPTPPPPPKPDPEPEIETIFEEPEIEVEEATPEPVITVEKEPEPEPEPVIYVTPEPEPPVIVVEDLSTGDESPIEIEVEAEEILESIPVMEEETTNTVSADEEVWPVSTQEPILIPTWDEATDEYVIQEAEVATGDYKIELNYPIRKIIRVVRRGAEKAFTSMITPDDPPDEDIADQKIHVKLNK